MHQVFAKISHVRTRKTAILIQPITHVRQVIYFGI